MLSERIIVSVTMDAGEDFYHCRGEQELFSMSKKTVSVLMKMAEELHVTVEEPVVLSDGKNHRYKNAPSCTSWSRICSDRIIINGGRRRTNCGS